MPTKTSPASTTALALAACPGLSRSGTERRHLHQSPAWRRPSAMIPACISASVLGVPVQARMPKTSARRVEAITGKGLSGTPSAMSSTTGRVPASQRRDWRTTLGRTTWPLEESVVVSLGASDIVTSFGRPVSKTKARHLCRQARSRVILREASWPSSGMEQVGSRHPCRTAATPKRQVAKAARRRHLDCSWAKFT